MMKNELESLELEAKIKTLQNQNDGLNLELEQIKKALANIRAIVNRKLDNNRIVLEEIFKESSFNEVEHKKLITYFQVFTKKLENNYIASLSIANGKISTISSNLGFEMSVISGFVNVVPLVGSIISLFVAAHDKIGRDIIEKQAKIMMNIASNSVELTDLVCKVGVKLLLHDKKQHEILSIKDSNNKTNKFFNFLKKEEKISNKAKIKIDGLLAIKELANKDALMLVMACLSGKIIHQDNKNYLEYQDQFVNLVINNSEFQEKFDEICTKELEKKDKIIEKKPFTSCNKCVIFMQTDIIYDNPGLIEDLQLQYYLNIPKLGSLEHSSEDVFQ
jgi:hypothetical protein